MYNMKRKPVSRLIDGVPASFVKLTSSVERNLLARYTDRGQEKRLINGEVEDSRGRKYVVKDGTLYRKAVSFE
jgi:hypothetical protein